MERQWSLMRGAVVLLVAGVCMLTGCAQTASSWRDATQAAVLPAALGGAGAGAGLGFRNFLGISVGGTVSTRDTDASGGYVEFAYSREFNRWVSVGIEAGYNEATEGAGSKIKSYMAPSIGVQVGNEFPTGQGRWYVVGGGGYIFNDFELDSRDRVTLGSEHNGATDIDIEDAPAFFLGMGAEAYRAINQSWNLALEARHVWHEVDAVYVGATTGSNVTLHLDRWVFRLTATYPF